MMEEQGIQAKIKGEKLERRQRLMFRKINPFSLWEMILPNNITITHCVRKLQISCPTYCHKIRKSQNMMF